MSREDLLNKLRKKEIAKWFLVNSPAGEIHYVAKDLRTLLNDEDIYNMAAHESFPSYNKSHLILVEMPGRNACVLISTFGELGENEYLDPRSAMVYTVDHVKQVCVGLRPAIDKELPSPYIEDFRSCVDSEISKYAREEYFKGACAVYCVRDGDVKGLGDDFELVIVVSSIRSSPQNFCNGSWRSIWNIAFKESSQVIEMRGTIKVWAHYFEDGNVQLDTEREYEVTSTLQSPENTAIVVTNTIRQLETEYLTFIMATYSKMPNTVFKELRRKLPVTRTMFPWRNTMQLNLTRDITRELAKGI